MNGKSVIACTYRPNLVAYNAFFGMWLKRNLFTRQRLLTALAAGCALMAIGVAPIMAHDLRDDLFRGHIWLTIAVGVVSLIMCLILTALFVYVASPLLTYLFQAAVFIVTANSRPMRTIEISEAGLSKSTGDSNTWPSIHEVVDTRSAVLIFTNKNCAVMIPKSAFATVKEAETFATSAVDYWQDAKSVF